MRISTLFDAKKLVLLFFGFIALTATAQRFHNKADSIFVFEQIAIAETFFSNSKYDSALYYCAKAEEFSKLKKFKKGQAYALIETTDIFIDKDELEKAADNATAAHKIGLQLNDSLIIAITWMQMAQGKLYADKTDEAILLFRKSIDYYFEKNPSRYSALAYNDFGYTWGMKGDLQKKAECILKAVNVYEMLDLPLYGERAAALNNLSTLYYELGQREKAIEYAKQSLFFREKSGDVSRLSLGCCNLSQMYRGVNNEEALKYQQLCVKYAEQSGDEMRVMQSYITSSLIASDQKNWKKSVEFELKAIHLLEKSKKDPDMLARRYIAAGMGSVALKEDSAITMGYFNKALQLSITRNDKFNLKDIYYQLAVFYKNHSDPARAYEFYTKHILYRDSIINSNTASNIAELETKYQTEKKNNEINRLNAEQRIKQLQIEKQKAIIAGNLLKATQNENEIRLLSQQKELQEVKFGKQSEELEKQILLARNNEQGLKLAEQQKQLQEKELQNGRQFRNLLIAGTVAVLLFAGFLFNRYQLKKKLEQQDLLLEMRNNISSNLHDDIGASLSNINILNELTKRNITNPEKANVYLYKAGDDIQRISESLSDIVWNINPQYDDLDNLFVRMKRYAADMLDGKNIHARLLFPNENERMTMPMDQRRDFYLVFKEAVNNLVKYSKATIATIEVTTSAGIIQLHVIDNGKGFDMVNPPSGNGLQNMKQRAEKWGSTFNIQSTPGNGTSLTLTMKI